MGVIPSGNITFLFTDIEGSTRLSQEFPETLQQALDKHHDILKNAIENNNGFVFEIVGDAFCCAFENAADAVKAAVNAQLALDQENWKDAEIIIRIGIHSGTAEWNGKRYLGYITLARTARVMSAAYGSQILISNNTFELCKDIFANENGLNEGNRNISFRDLGERRLKDLLQPVRLYQVTATDLRDDFPPLKTLDRRRNNLPVQLTSFIGRETEIQSIKKLFRQTSLLTLTGTGGSGKTRLALKIGTDVIDEFESGVWFAEFDSLTESSQLESAIAKVFGIIEQPKISVEEQLLDYIKDKEMLLILDNCEHVVTAASLLAYKLLKSCPKLKIIATSREALRCEGERVYSLSSLNYPKPNGKFTSEKISKYESVKLFNERASSVNTSFSLNDDNADAIAKISYRLEGIPLAIELAAARTKTLSPEQIYQRLDDRFSLLNTGYRTALPRQQTLKAAIDWSYELLSENEKTLWNRLSVFSGGWTLEAAEDICSDEKICSSEMIELLEALAEKSIITFNEVKVRYRMLESIRQFGARKLKDSNELDSITENHFKYYSSLTAEADEKIKGHDEIQWMKVLDDESPNILKAYEWSCKNKSAEDTAKLALALKNYWDIRGFRTESLRRFESILERMTDHNSVIYYKIKTATGFFNRLKSKYDTAEKFFTECLNFYKESNNKSGIAETLNNLGVTAYDRGEYGKALDYYRENLLLINEIEDEREKANLFYNLGNVSFYRGEYPAALEYYQKSLDIRRVTGNKSTIAYNLNGLGLIALVNGENSAAHRYFEESLLLSKEIGFKHLTAVILNNLGSLSHENADYLKAIMYFGESLSIRRETGDKRGIALMLCNLGSMTFELGNYTRTLDYYKESLDISREIGDKSVTVLSLVNMGYAVYELGDFGKAAKLFEEGLNISREIGEKPSIAYSLVGLGNISLLYGDYEKTSQNYNESYEIRNEIGDKRGISMSLNELADIDLARGNYSEALNLYEQSLKLNRELEYKSGMIYSLTGIAAAMIEKDELIQAMKYLNESISICKETGNKRQTSMCLYYLGRAFLKKESFEDAIKNFIKALTIKKELGNRYECAISILSLAIVNVMTKDYKFALQLLSYVDNYLKLNNIVLHKSEQESFDGAMNRLSVEMNPVDFSEYLKKGKLLTDDEAFVLAIDNN